MPRREDERWSAEGNPLRYCWKHRCYYDEHIGCQECGAGETDVRNQTGGTPPLKICPKCGHKSVFWNSSLSVYECLNRACRKKFTKDEITPGGGHAMGEARSSGIQFKRRSWTQDLPSKMRWAWAGWKHLPLKKWLLILVLAAGLSLAGYTGHLLVAKRIGSIPGWVILGLDAVLLMWSISLLRHRWKPSSSGVFGVLVAAALLASTACAYGGVAPFCGVKQSIVDRLGGSTTSNVEVLKIAVYEKSLWDLADMFTDDPIIKGVSASISRSQYQGTYVLVVKLKPTANTESNEWYTIKLVPKDPNMSSYTQSVSFAPIEVSQRTRQALWFPCSYSEGQTLVSAYPADTQTLYIAYTFTKDIKGLFKVTCEAG